MVKTLRDWLAKLGNLPHLDIALTHPSVPYAENNQRLEFLGDRVLGLVVATMLMERFPAAREGHLSCMSSAAVSTEALAIWARSVDLGASLHLGRGAEVQGERNADGILADATEALIGAVFLDCGLPAARDLVSMVTRSALAGVTPESGRDPKGELQERLDVSRESPAEYRTSATGPEHATTFTSKVFSRQGAYLGTGSGATKKSAERAAARDALTKTPRRESMAH